MECAGDKGTPLSFVWWSDAAGLEKWLHNLSVSPKVNEKCVLKGQAPLSLLPCNICLPVEQTHPQKVLPLCGLPPQTSSSKGASQEAAVMQTQLLPSSGPVGIAPGPMQGC